MPDAARQSLEEPDMGPGAGQFDVAKPLASNLGKRDFNTAFVADHTAVFHPFVFAAQAFPVRDGTENASAEQTILLRLERPIVDGLRLGYFAMRPRANLFWRGQTDPNAVKIGDRCRPVIRIRSNQFHSLLTAASGTRAEARDYIEMPSAAC